MQITESLIQAIANYLMTKPYQEVAGLLGALQQEAQVQTKPEEPKEVAMTATEAKEKREKEEVLPPKVEEEGPKSEKE